MFYHYHDFTPPQAYSLPIDALLHIVSPFKIDVYWLRRDNITYSRNANHATIDEFIAHYAATDQSTFKLLGTYPTIEAFTLANPELFI